MKIHKLKIRDDPINHLSWIVCDKCYSAAVYNEKNPLSRLCSMCGSTKATIKNLGFCRCESCRSIQQKGNTKFLKYNLKEK